MDWQQLIDEAVDRRFDDATLPEPDLPARVAAGRVALRRRRAAVASLTCAAVVVVGGAAWALPSGSTDSTGPAPATSAPGTPTSEPTPSVDPSAISPATLDAATGELVVEAGWDIVHRVDRPLHRLVDGPAPTRSLALDLRHGSEERWVLLYWQPGDGSTAIHDAAGVNGVPDFFYWLDLHVALTTGEWSTAVVGRDSNALAEGAGLTILDQRRAPELGSLVRVAEVVAAGYQRWLVARPAPTGGLEARLVSFPPGADPDAFISYVRDQHLLEAGR